MKIETKFNFKDKVHKIWFTNITEWVPCGFCGGEGNMEGLNKKINICPDCNGRRGSKNVIGKKWVSNEVLTIGEIRVESRCEHISDGDEYFSNYGNQKEHYKESYMCYETGIGSGTLWPADVLFNTLEEAESECNRRNKEGLK